MSVPQARSQRVERLVVEAETSVGSGQFVVDSRLRAEQVEVGSDDRLGRALISVRLDEQMTFVEARATYHPQRRLMVRTDGGAASGRRVLFDGYPPVQESRWGERAGAGQAAYGFWAEHVMERVGRDRAAQIVGRYVRTGEILDGLAGDGQAWADKRALLTALPCVFNLDGSGNCDPAPLEVASPAGGTRLIHIFSDDLDRHAVPWTLGRILRYLVYFYLPRGGCVCGETVLSLTDEYAEAGLNGSEPSEADALGAGLRTEPASLTCEAASVLEALLLVANEGGCHFATSSAKEQGRLCSWLTFWSQKAGRKRWLYLARGGRDGSGAARYPTGGKSGDQILADNNVSSVRAVLDWRGLGVERLIVGAVKKHEMTVPLVPGWLPLSGLDNVAEEDRAAAKAEALLPADVGRLGEAAEQLDWFKRHHRGGSSYKLYINYVRRWVLNEHGRYDAGYYNRNAPFDDYRPFDFSTVCDETVTTRGAWMRRGRRFLPTIRRPDWPESKVWVEISFDGGASWHLQSSGVRVLSDECGIFLACDNPCQITPPGVWPDEQNLWYAIVDQVCCVRVTALIESDERICYEQGCGDAGRTVAYLGREVVYRPREFEFISSEGTTNVLSELPADGRDDTEQMALLARRLSQAGSGSPVKVWPVIPWMDDAYELGDRIMGIWGRGVLFADGHDGQGLPTVVGKVYRCSGSRYETELVLG